MLKAAGKILKVGGWAPLLVLASHLFLSRVIHAYRLWPRTDIPVHLLGGLAFAFFISRCFQSLPRSTIQKSHVAILELLLAICITTTAAVFWEFNEFTRDQLFGTNIQVSLSNTMQDLAMGMVGALVFIIIRSRQLCVGTRELQEITQDWIRWYAA